MDTTCSDLEHKRHHGGLLRRAALDYGIRLEDWLDLSTGINPNGWPVPEVPPQVWTRLPENEDGLLTAAVAYYQTSSLLAVAGSQAVIQCVPFLRQHSRVLLLTPSYAEHARAWRVRGHTVKECMPSQVDAFLSSSDVLIIVNPNNPSAHRFDVSTLLAWHRQLAQKGGWLIIDEAYIDCQPNQSLLPYCPREGLIVLRSLGKFFGLAGLRLGFVAAENDLLEQIADFLGPWAVNGPARWVAQQALGDKQWQQDTRQRLIKDSLRLQQLLRQNHLTPSAGCELFQWVQHEQAARLFSDFAEHGILTRLFLQPASLRFGLPGNEQGWEKLEIALLEISKRNSVTKACHIRRNSRVAIDLAQEGASS